MKKKLNIENHIIEIAADVFEEKGFAGARMQQIADQAKINKSLLHYYFRSKEKLFEKSFIIIANRIFAKLGQAFNFSGSISEKITNFLENSQYILWKNRNFLILFINELNQNEELLKKLMDEINMSQELNIFLSQLKEEQEKGILRNDVEPIVLLVNIISLSVFPYVGKPIISQIVEQLNYDYEDYLEIHKKQIAQFIINSIKNPDYKD
ncbi:MAG: TetR/AcrR family transcriptional regulator [Bacteroidales bacterium]|nr:TetR/AcrR family transcriptional regulator [Bacteroidales bacterium]MCK9498523.1 TetR/AcrR family transcriptional regulator [Bacteroidales bacterium]MDY0314268.1 TetR/AcrR family transcriptional regulator [Bacteroidales bacterium]NLB86426.1 TetR/AcrR family transcriptional regulator [Bacteroidales bacterium]